MYSENLVGFSQNIQSVYSWNIGKTPHSGKLG